MGSGQWAAAPGLVLLRNIQVDVTTRLGAMNEFLSTGLTPLDEVLGGGLSPGDLMLVSGAPGTGKTAFALLNAYMAARARAATLYTSILLDDTEVVARLAARALHREYKNANASYGTIWSGEAWQEPQLSGPVASSVEQVVRKVGAHLHLHRGLPLEPMNHITAMVGVLMQRHERVMLVIDGIEGFSAEAKGVSRDLLNAQLEARWLQIGLELRALAGTGAIVVATCQERAAEYTAPAATVVARLSRGAGVDHRGTPSGLQKVVLETELTVVKNRSGPARVIPLRFVPEASLFEAG